MERWPDPREAFRYLAALGLDSVLSLCVLKTKHDDLLVKSAKDAGLRVTIGVPGPWRMPLGDFQSAYGTSSLSNKAVQNRCFSFWAPLDWMEDHFGRAQSLGVDGVALVVNPDQISFPNYWKPGTRERYGYWVFAPEARAAFRAWCWDKYGVKMEPARTPDEDHDGLTLEFCRDTLLRVLREMVQRCGDRFDELLLSHELGRWAHEWELAGGRAGITHDLEGVLPAGSWLMIPQVYTHFVQMPWMKYAQQEAAVLARRGPWRTMVGVELTGGMKYGNARHVPLGGHAGFVFAPAGVFNKETWRPNRDEGAAVAAAVAEAESTWPNRPHKEVPHARQRASHDPVGREPHRQDPAPHHA